MGSTAAIWAGHGTPPAITSGDAETMAAPRPGFDPSLNPGAPEAVESTHTVDSAAAHAAKAAPAKDAKAAPAKDAKAADAKDAKAPEGEAKAKTLA